MVGGYYLPLGLGQVSAPGTGAKTGKISKTAGLKPPVSKSSSKRPQAATGDGYPVGQGEQHGKPQAMAIGTTLQAALDKTLLGKLNWQRERLRSEPAQMSQGALTDKFFTRMGNVNLIWQGQVPPGKNDRLPQEIRQWQLTLEDEASGAIKTLDGQSCYLPDRVHAETDRTVDTLPKLVRAVYESSLKQYDALMPMLDEFRAGLESGEISASSSYVKPNLKYGLPMGFRMIQIGHQLPRLEIAQFSNQMRMTLHQKEGGVTKWDEQALKHPEVGASLKALLDLVD